MKKLFGIMICIALVLTGCGGPGGGDKSDYRTKIACILRNRTDDDFSKYQRLLEPYGFSLTLVTDECITRTNFSPFKSIIIGEYDSCISREAAITIQQSRKPVLGIGFWGLSYFKMATNCPHLSSAKSTQYGVSSIIVSNPNDIIWTYPNKINTGNGKLEINAVPSESVYAVCDTDLYNANNISFGYTLFTEHGYGNTRFHTLVLENKHNFFWGYPYPQLLTDVGKKLFVNVVDYMTKQ